MNLRTKLPALLASLALLLLTSGCFDTTEDFTINPDGSGKVTHECNFQPISFGNDKSDPEEAMRNAVKELLKGTKGVDTWRDVTFKLLDDGRISFRGTAYFKDLSKLDIPNQAMLEFNWKKTGNGEAVLDLRTNKSHRAGGFTIDDEPKSKSTAQLSPAELEKKLKQDRVKFQQAKPMLAGFLGPLKHNVTLHLPGKIASSSNFKNTGSGTLTVGVEGAKLLEGMEKLVNDDEWCRKHGSPSLDAEPTMDDEMNQMVFGTKAPLSAKITEATAPLFDYQSEVAAAKKDAGKIEKALGVSDGAFAPPAQGQPLKKAEIVGAKLVTWSDQKQELSPFHDQAGYTVAVMIELPGSVLDFTDKSGVDIATADDGTSLVKESEWDRRFHFPQLSKDKSKAILEIQLKPPGKDVKGLKELSGHVQYQVASATKEVDLGITEIKADTKGTALGANIKKIKEGWQKDGSQQMELKLDLEPSDIKSLSLVVDGNKTALDQSGYGGGGGSYTFTFTSKEAFPAKGKLVAEVYDKVQTFVVPFKIENVTLLGAPMQTK